MKVKGTHIDYFLMIICFIMSVLGICWKDDMLRHFGMLGFISGGIHYLADKIDELKK